MVKYTTKSICGVRLQAKTTGQSNNMTLQGNNNK